MIYLAIFITAWALGIVTGLAHRKQPVVLIGVDVPLLPSWIDVPTAKRRARQPSN